MSRTARFLIATSLVAFLGCGGDSRPAMAPLPEDGAGLEADTGTTSTESAKLGLTVDGAAAPSGAMAPGSD